MRATQQLIGGRRKTEVGRRTTDETAFRLPPPDFRLRQAGQAITEFAIVLPVLVLLLFGIINYGLAFAEYNTLGFAASRAAQRAALITDPTPTAGDYQAISQTIASALTAPIDASAVISSTTFDPATSAMTITLQYTHHPVGLAHMAAMTINLQTQRTAQLLALGTAPVLNAQSPVCNPDGTYQQIALQWTAAAPPVGRTVGSYALLRTDGTTVAVTGTQTTAYTDTVSAAGPLTYTVQAVYDNLAQGPQSNALAFPQTCSP
jgi:Flp pilus assembly protein TadG